MDFIIAALELSGGWVVGNKNKIGFLLLMASNVGWVLWVLITKQTYGLLLVVIPAFVINIRNYIKWLKEQKATK